MKKILLFLILFISPIFAGVINVAGASNISYAIGELIQEFHKLYPNTEVRINLGSSGKLTAQIENGAPYQIFMSANMKYPKILYKDKKAVTKPIVYAKGELAFFTIKKINLSQGIKVLENNSIKRIAIANPKIAPYGKASFQAIKNAGIFQNIKYKFIFAESISQTLIYSITATDIGIVAKSALFSPRMKHFKKGVNWVDVNQKLYTPINQGIVILKNGADSKEVKNFYNFMLSPKAKLILKKYGYII